ncbi:uncharacterized protein LOC133745821 [Rosa rugosa]|uniref:uncharacterized protein LOC133745821 n=1 Tax=Rosa rugosa TaxID=74645 RepID=UPI002B40724D|nr:uncharacterized protein LOC133745821 [Rosa rugosa]
MSAVIGMKLPRGSACFYFYNPLEYIQREAAVNATAVESRTEQATHDLVSYINEQMAASLNRINSETQVARDAATVAANENLNKLLGLLVLLSQLLGMSVISWCL